MSANFVHLHNHSEYSLYDGFQSPAEMAKRAKELGFSAIALTDHGQVGGLFQFQKACKKEGIKPILGVELYISEDLADKKSKRYHLVVLAKNNIGLKNLFKICTIANKNKTGNFPRINFDILYEHREGLIISTACIGGEFAQYVIKGDLKKAYEFAEKYQSVWGEDFYLEVMWTKIPEQKEVIKYALECGRNLGIKVIATNDCHYLTKEDAKYQQIKKSINIGKPLPYTDAPEYYIKSYEEMSKVFKGPEGEPLLTNTMEIAEKCNAEIEVGKVQLPDFKIKYDEEFEEFKKTQWNKTDIQAYLIFNARKGLKKLGLDKNEVYAARLEEELETIRFTSFDSYFLIVQDYINFAKSNIDPFTGKEKKSTRVGLGRGCFLPKNQVKTKDGLKNIEDIKIGEIVLSHDGTLNEVIDVLKYDVDEEIIEIEMNDGRKISCTLDHKILVKRNDQELWVRSDEIGEGEEIVDVDGN